MAKQVPLSDDILWGAEAIGEYIGRDRTQVYYLIGKGAIPVTKLGRKMLIARKSEIDTVFTAVQQYIPEDEPPEPIPPPKVKRLKG